MDRSDEQPRQDCEPPTEPIDLTQAGKLLDLHAGHNYPRLHDALAYTTSVMR